MSDKQSFLRHNWKLFYNNTIYILLESLTISIAVSLVDAFYIRVPPQGIDLYLYAIRSIFTYGLFIMVLIFLLRTTLARLNVISKGIEDAHREHEGNFSTYFKKNWDKYTENKQIVVRLDMLVRPFNKDNLIFFSDIFILKALTPSPNTTGHRFHGGNAHIVAIDWSDPTSWLTDDMMTYLAMQATWLRKDLNRKVSRIFLVNDLEAVTARMLIIHSILGFETYVLNRNRISDSSFNEWGNEYRRDALFWYNPDPYLIFSTINAMDMYGYVSTAKGGIYSSSDRESGDINRTLNFITDIEISRKYLDIFTKLMDWCKDVTCTRCSSGTISAPKLDSNALRGCACGFYIPSGFFSDLANHAGLNGLETRFVSFREHWTRSD